MADHENMKVASKALNEMSTSNSTLEELESAVHKALAKFTVMSAPERELSNRIDELEVIFIELTLFKQRGSSERNRCKRKQDNLSV